MEPQESMIVKAIDSGAFKNPAVAINVLKGLNVDAIEFYEHLLKLLSMTEDATIREVITAMIFAVHGISGTISLMLFKQIAVKPDRLP